MELLLDLAFMVFALGFFTFATKNVLNQDDKEYARQLNERREFGYDAKAKNKNR